MNSSVLLPLLAFLIASPFLPFLGVPIRETGWMLTDWQRVLELLAVSTALLAASFSVWKAGGAGYRFSLYRLGGWGGFFLLGALSVLAAAYPKHAGIEWSWSLCCILLAAILGVSPVIDRDEFRRAVLFLVMAVVTSYTPLYYIANSDLLFLPPLIWEPSLIGFNNPRAFSDYQSVVVCLLPWAITAASKSVWGRGLAYCLGGAYVALALVSGSRSLFLGQFAALAALAAFFPRRAFFRYFFGQCLLWACAAAFYWLAFICLPESMAEVPTSSLAAVKNALVRTYHSGRMDLWKLAWDLGSVNPLLGVGPMHFAAQLNPDAASPHNVILQIFAEWGGPASILFAVLLAGWTLERGRLLSSSGGAGVDIYAASLFAAWVAMLAQSMVSPVFNNPHSQVLLIVIAGAAGRCDGAQGNSAAYRTFHRFLPISAVAALVGFWLLCGPWLVRIDERNICYRQSVEAPTRHWAPRFWHQGWLLPACESL